MSNQFSPLAVKTLGAAQGAAGSEGRLAGKCVFVTGGTRGIGAALVRLFRAEGADVTFIGRDAVRGDDLAAATGARFIAADVTDMTAMRGAFATLDSMHGRLDVLVNNAGATTARDSITQFDATAFDAMVALHIAVPWQLIALATPAMQRAQNGSIINITSVAGHRVGANSIAYSVCKAALLHLTRFAAAELGKDGIRVNSVSPGFVPTDIHSAGREAGSEQAMARAETMARLFALRQALPITGNAYDVATTCLFLASDESRFVSGHDLVVDGGMIWGQNVRL